MSRLAAIVFAALLVGSLIITLELVHQGGAGHTKITPTLTGTASIRTQWNHQNTVWGIFTMIDATTGWSEVGQFSVASLAATQNDTISGILRTTDGGNHWQDVTPPHSWFSTEAFLTATVAWGFGTYNNDGRDYMYRTVDGGQTWQVEPVPLYLDLNYYRHSFQQIYALNAQECWLLYRNMNFRTTDGGKSWIKVATPDGVSAATDFTHITFINSTIGWLAGTSSSTNGSVGNALYVTHDGGQTWQQQALPLPLPSTASQYYLTTPTFFSPVDGILPVAISSEILGTGGTIFYRTSDGGMTWHETSTLPLVINGYDANVVFTNINHWLVLVDTGYANYTPTYKLPLYVTTDGGQHWKTQKSSAGAHDMYSFNFVSDAVGWGVGDNMPPRYPAEAYRNTLYKTVDGGRTWTEINFMVS